MGYSTIPVNEFVDKLGSGAPTPGGGGASALVGALGIALGNMVAHLTIGKKRYASVELDMLELKAKASNLQDELVALIERDAEVFAPLAAAYSMPKETEEEKAERDRVMEHVLDEACSVPLEIMEKVCKSLELVREAAQKGSAGVISDAGDAAVFCKAALQGASLNVYINTRSMKDRERAALCNKKADDMLAVYCPMADEIFESVKSRLYPA
jgi:formiminotetrahydrofolate cyclodeaminase